MKILNTLLISLLAYSASAQVGIGTSTPDSPLDIEAVDAAIDINNSDSSDDPKINFQLTDVTTFSIGVDNADSKFKIGTTAPATGTAVTVQSTGEVGIGTTSPQALLHIKQTTADAYGVYVDDGTSWISLVPNLATGGYNPISEAGDVGLFFSTDNNSAAVAGNGLVIAAHSTSSSGLKIEEDGKVGIGTATPTATLDVDGSAIFNESHAAVDFRVEGDTEANLLFVDGSADKIGIGTALPGTDLHINAFNDGFKVGNTSETGLLYTTYESTKSYLTLEDEDDAVIFRGIQNDNTDVGFLAFNDTYAGIGTESPNTALHVTAGVDATATSLRLENTDTDLTITQEVSAIQFYSNDASADGTGITSKIAQISESNGGRMGLAFSTSNNGIAEVVRIDYRGNVGIAMTAPSVELDVTGDIEYTGTITDVSDRRLKENFSSIDSVLTKIMKIEGLSYNMINDSTKRREYGVIAQDVQVVFPEMVTIVDPDNGYLGVAYIQLVPVLLEATKAQQAIIEAQKAEIATEKAENESQKQEIETIKAEASTNTTETAQKLAALEAKLNALLLLNSKGAVVTTEN